MIVPIIIINVIIYVPDICHSYFTLNRVTTTIYFTVYVPDGTLNVIVLSCKGKKGNPGPAGPSGMKGDGIPGPMVIKMKATHEY